MHKIITLENGLRVILVPFEGTDACTFLAYCKVGSRYEYKEINGAAHFIEHMMFKGTKKRHRTIDISRVLDAMGAEYNAFTGKETTGYYVKSDFKHAKTSIELLHDMLFNSRFDARELERERGVIVEEINMYKDNPMMHIDELLESEMYEGSTLGWEIGGSHQTVQSMTRQQMIEFKQSYYSPDNMVVCLAGKINNDLLTAVKKTFGKEKQATDTQRGFCKYSSLPSQKIVKARVQYKDTAQIQFALGFPAFAISDKRTPALDLLSVILGGTMSSRLFISVRERKGLAYYIRAFGDSYTDTGAFIVQAGLDKSRLKLAYKTILSELRKIKKEKVSASEIKEAKDHISGKIALRMENSYDRADWYAKTQLYFGKVITPQQRLAEIQKVTPAQIQAVARQVLDEKKMTVAGIGPYKTKQSLLGILHKA
ncbi:MAG: pitrilysin family protein [Patescibacteria group bacterium]